MHGHAFDDGRAFDDSSAFDCIGHRFELVSANATHNTRRDLKFEARPVPRKDLSLIHI